MAFFFKQCNELKPNLEAHPLVHHSLSAASNEHIPICYEEQDCWRQIYIGWSEVNITAFHHHQQQAFVCSQIRYSAFMKFVYCWMTESLVLMQTFLSLSVMDCLSHSSFLIISPLPFCRTESELFVLASSVMHVQLESTCVAAPL